MTFISALLTLGCFILVFKAIARDTYSVQSKSADEQSDIDFITISTQLDYINDLKDKIQNLKYRCNENCNENYEI